MPRSDNSHTRRRRLNQVCITFESAISKDENPSIGTFISRLAPAEQADCLQELLWIEWEHLRRNNQPIEIADYLEAHKDHHELVRKAWKSDCERGHQANRHYEPRTDRYQVLRPHANGGLGQVYQAIDREVGRFVALKEVRDKLQSDQTAQQRLLREARITGKLEHPGIVPVFSIGESENGVPYYTMRFIHGSSLLDAIESFHSETPTNISAADSTCVNTKDTVASDAREQPEESVTPHSKVKRRAYRSLQFRKLLTKFSYVCQVIHYAHSEGVLHRDLKPGNIILGEHGDTVVVDWGLAKEFLAEQLPESEMIPEPELIPETVVISESTAEQLNQSEYATTHGTQIGTPAYGSPEQLSGNLASLQPTTDIYSLGASLFHLLTGVPPPKELHKRLHALRTTPAPLAAICLKAIETDPKHRYESAAAMASDIDSWLADQKVSAYKEPLTNRVLRWSRANSAWAASCLVTCILVSVGATAIAVALNARGQELKTANERALEEARVAERERDASEALSQFLTKTIAFEAAPAIEMNLRLFKAFTELRDTKTLVPSIRARMMLAVFTALNAGREFNQAHKVGEYMQKNAVVGLLPPPGKVRYWEARVVSLCHCKNHFEAQCFARAIRCRHVQEGNMDAAIRIGQITVDCLLERQAFEFVPSHLDATHDLLNAHVKDLRDDRWVQFTKSRARFLRSEKEVAKVLNILQDQIERLEPGSARFDLELMIVAQLYEQQLYEDVRARIAKLREQNVRTSSDFEYNEYMLNWWTERLAEAANAASGSP